MKIIPLAYQQLFDKEIPYEYKIKYSGRFKGYNANITLHKNVLTLNLSKNWRGVSRDIQIGLIQELMVKLFKKKKHTLNMDLYNIFLKKVHIAIPKTKSHPLLENSFKRNNSKFFNELMEQPNLVWGVGRRKLGHYDFGTDTILLSKVLRDDQELLDYVMYHEMLHKKHKFSSSKGRQSYHSKKFRDEEKLFPNAHLLEKRLSRIGRKKLFGLF
jgi:hypothetical protein